MKPAAPERKVFMSKVFYLPLDNMDGKCSGISELVKSVFDSKAVRPADITAVKIHPGEEGNTSYVSAKDISSIISAMDIDRDSVFLTDTTVLYPGRRMTAPQYLRLSREHGFGLPDTPPFLVADGLHGEDEYLLKTPDDFETEEIHLARLIANADSMVVVSHFKGHLLMGFGGALKNLGMGCA
ncbi:MAG: DUF362 domain-containing protein, partial [Candidatus Aegiribacteria sp.]|nr:DUF362 domain-containing protein [Candidatus Aegiribacteria sp.]